MTKTITRREMLAGTAAAGLCLSTLAGRPSAAEKKPAFKIGACDWSIGCHQNIRAFEVAKKIGLDGVEVSFDGGDKFDLRREDVREQYLDTSKKSGVEIASLAMGVLNRVPYATDPRAEKWVEECIDVMPKLNVKIVLMAFFSRGDIRGKVDLQDKVIQRLKKVASKAEKAGVVLGVESWLNVDDHLRILDAVDSPAVKVYYDVANMAYSDYDVPKEIRRLGAERICQIHMKERGCLLGKGKVDFPKIKEAIEEIDYRGWFIIESAMAPGKSLQECYTANREFLDKLFSGS